MQTSTSVVVNPVNSIGGANPKDTSFKARYLPVAAINPKDVIRAYDPSTGMSVESTVRWISEAIVEQYYLDIAIKDNINVNSGMRSLSGINQDHPHAVISPGTSSGSGVNALNVLDGGSGSVDPNLLLPTEIGPGILSVAPEQLVYINNEFKPASEIEIGDQLLTNEGYGMVASIEPVYKPINIYYLELGNNHNYFADGILVSDRSIYSNAAIGDATISINSCFLAGTKISMGSENDVRSERPNGDTNTGIPENPKIDYDLGIDPINKDIVGEESKGSSDTKNIENIQIGDVVKAFDRENDVIVDAHISKVSVHSPKDIQDNYMIIRSTVLSNEEIQEFRQAADISDYLSSIDSSKGTYELKVTPNHPLYVISDSTDTAASKTYQILKANQVEIGDMLSTINEEIAVVHYIGGLDAKLTTYNIEVENYHNYFANGILVNDKQINNNAADLITSNPGKQEEDEKPYVPDNKIEKLLGPSVSDLDKNEVNVYKPSHISFSLDFEKVSESYNDIEETSWIYNLVKILVKILPGLENIPFIKNILDSVKSVDSGINDDKAEKDTNDKTQQEEQETVKEEKDTSNAEEDDTTDTTNEEGVIESIKDINKEVTTQKKDDYPSYISAISDQIGGESNGIRYIWDFGDGNIGYGLKPTHSYEIQGPSTESSTSYNANSFATGLSGESYWISNQKTVIEYPVKLFIIGRAGNVIDIDESTISVEVPWVVESKPSPVQNNNQNDDPYSYESNSKNIEDIEEGDFVLSYNEASITNDNNLVATEVLEAIHYESTELVEHMVIEFEPQENQISENNQEVADEISQILDSDLIPTFSYLSFDPPAIDVPVIPIDDAGNSDSSVISGNDNTNSDSHELKVTRNHLILVNYEFKPAIEINVGDILYTIDGKEAIVTSVRAESGYVDIYNINLEAHHNYFANGILVGDKTTVEKSNGILSENEYVPSGFLSGTEIAITSYPDNSNINSNGGIDNPVEPTSEQIPTDDLILYSSDIRNNEDNFRAKIITKAF